MNKFELIARPSWDAPMIETKNILINLKDGTIKNLDAEGSKGDFLTRKIFINLKNGTFIDLDAKKVEDEKLTANPPQKHASGQIDDTMSDAGSNNGEAEGEAEEQSTTEEDPKPSRRMDCGTCFAKYMLCLFNFVFFIVGAVVLSLGVWLYADKTSLISFTKLVQDFPKLEHTLVIAYIAYILIAAGAFIFLLSLVGYCAALRESRCLLGFYGFLLLVILILEITAAGLAFAYRERTEMEIKNFLTDTVKDYDPDATNTSGDPSHAWDLLMVDLQCCGLNNYTDFGMSEKFKQKGWKLPKTCCKLSNNGSSVLDPDCVNSPKLENSNYLTGCYDTVMNQLKQHFSIVIYVIIGIVLVELLLTLLAFCLCKTLEPYDK